MHLLFGHFHSITRSIFSIHCLKYGLHRTLSSDIDSTDVSGLESTMTSLAYQLKRLALPQNDPNLLSRKEVASFLFDPNEAATLDRSTFYALGKSLCSTSLAFPSFFFLCNLSNFAFMQAVRAWRSSWGSNRPLGSSRTLSSAGHRSRWSAASSRKMSTRS